MLLLSIILGCGAVLIILDLTLEYLVTKTRKLRKGSVKGNLRDLEWKLNSTLHLHRLAHYEVGDGHWVAKKNVPTIPVDILLGVAGGDSDEPNFVLPNPRVSDSLPGQSPPGPPAQSPTSPKPTVGIEVCLTSSTSSSSPPSTTQQPPSLDPVGRHAVACQSSTTELTPEPRPSTEVFNTLSPTTTELPSVLTQSSANEPALVPLTSTLSPNTTSPTFASPSTPVSDVEQESHASNGPATTANQIENYDQVRDNQGIFRPRSY